MSRKVYVNVTFQLVLDCDDDANVNEIVNEMDYDFCLNTDKSELLDTELQDWNIVDSKKKKTINNHEINFCMESPEYFQGYGTSFTILWNDVKIGCGSTLSEALNDCLEQIAEEYILTNELETQIYNELSKDQNINQTAPQDFMFYIAIYLK